MTDSPDGGTLRRAVAAVGHAKARIASVRSAARIGLAISLAGAASCVGSFAFTTAAHAEYHSFFEAYLASGQIYRDSDPPYEHGGYHTWAHGEAYRYGRPKVPELCLVLWNGSADEAGSRCLLETYEIVTTFFNRENAEAEMAGWAYNGGDLTMQGEVEA